MIRFMGLNAVLGFCLSLGAVDVYASTDSVTEDSLSKNFRCLPGDIQKVLCELLSDDDLRNLSQVSKAMRQISSQDKFWEKRYKQYYVYPIEFYVNNSSVAKGILAGNFTVQHLKGKDNLKSLCLSPYPKFKTLIQCRYKVAHQIRDAIKATSEKEMAEESYERLLVAEEYIGGADSNMPPQRLQTHVDSLISSVDISYKIPKEERLKLVIELLDRFIGIGSKYAVKIKKERTEVEDV